MFGVTHKHRYFRIQVIVSVTVGMAVYLATKGGLIPQGYHDSIPQQVGLELWTIGPVLAACVLVYFRRASLDLWSVIGTSLLIYICVFGTLPFIAASDGASRGDQVWLYFAFLNFVGMLIFGGVNAWLGKLLGVLTVFALGLSITTGQMEILVLTPLLTLLNITNVYAQWFVAIVITASRPECRYLGNHPR